MFSQAAELMANRLCLRVKLAGRLNTHIVTKTLCKKTSWSSDYLQWRLFTFVSEASLQCFLRLEFPKREKLPRNLATRLNHVHGPAGIKWFVTKQTLSVSWTKTLGNKSTFHRESQPLYRRDFGKPSTRLIAKTRDRILDCRKEWGSSSHTAVVDKLGNHRT